LVVFVEIAALTATDGAMDQEAIVPIVEVSGERLSLGQRVRHLQKL